MPTRPTPTARHARTARRGRMAAVAAVAALACAGLVTVNAATASTPATDTSTARAAAPAATSWPTLQAGARGAEVTALQHLLVAGGRSVAVDGEFGPATAQAVKAFQKGEGLAVDGIVGPATWGELVPTLRQGARGPAVKAAQALLKSRGQSVAVDGQFGPGTAAAVKAVQKASGLTADGVVGPRSWSALLSPGSGTPDPGTPSGNRAALAEKILGTGGITLATVHPGGTHAGSTARQNIVDTAAGKGALTSPWSDRPNQRVALDTRMLDGLLKLRSQYGHRVSVSEIVGGDHSSNSRHYAGLSFDVNYIDGRHVGEGAPHRDLMAACRKLGATEVLGPGDAGHSRHVHCGWPR
ncbi:peptidoglycan-binding domain-containing protein [Streptomyces cavernicola]|uniref:Peptidoglycan-binding protein n=1 Tax=Streptomyces cavernicola TaxID=3043613 RepID=A0ABT6S5Q7_9ACTN|nr:peptidoglycan-binding protein [Streptomyces sp. B-S-A6]MDI3403428.1 peptidoglycan-binding protein [Streptomyces sp. B-S-A6]